MRVTGTHIDSTNHYKRTLLHNTITVRSMCTYCGQLLEGNVLDGMRVEEDLHLKGCEPFWTVASEIQDLLPKQWGEPRLFLVNKK